MRLPGPNLNLDQTSVRFNRFRFRTSVQNQTSASLIVLLLRSLAPLVCGWKDVESLCLTPVRIIGNDTGQPNPTGSRVRVSLGSGAGHGESTRDPGPTHLKGNSQRRPTKANAGQCRPTAANEGQCRPAKTKKG